MRQKLVGPLGLVLLSATVAGAQVPRDRDQIWYEVTATAAILDGIGGVIKAQCLDRRPATLDLNSVCVTLDNTVHGLRTYLALLCKEGKFGRAKPSEPALCPSRPSGAAPDGFWLLCV